MNQHQEWKAREAISLYARQQMEERWYVTSMPNLATSSFASKLFLSALTPPLLLTSMFIYIFMTILSQFSKVFLLYFRNYSVILIFEIIWTDMNLFLNYSFLSTHSSLRQMCFMCCKDLRVSSTQKNSDSNNNNKTNQDSKETPENKSTTTNCPSCNLAFCSTDCATNPLHALECGLIPKVCQTVIEADEQNIQLDLSTMLLIVRVS